ncbi:Down syndrome cell adhesion molecule-like protein Dscam2 [Zerene cesonia]|uniref:Down syndrome cell adhesion molecule-like protein Dscam2 n=1 Tax=Zerene cesonia TaxID=33412 RepID=UPI0018E567C0|nr:Down syndrome cell adhesion molecule-like protein Dscam2 [Zerene cesonia]
MFNLFSQIFFIYIATSFLTTLKLNNRQESSDPDSDVILEYRLDGLRPATAYAVRVAAINDIGDSDYSDSVILNTLEEAPSEPPRSVEVLADAPGELLVKWQPPPQESWNGELVGYAVWCRGANASLALGVAGWAARAARLGALRPAARYELSVRALNALGAGPAAAPLLATTLEDVPEAPPQNVRCEPLSSQSFRVWWEPPPPLLRGGLIIGYEISYRAAEADAAAAWERVSAGGGGAAVAARAGNYSLRVAARSAAGLGPRAARYCNTLDDVPGPPADVKVFPHSEDSVMLSWLPPLQPNGLIRHYRVYTRPQRIGRHSSEVVLVSEQQQRAEQALVLSGLAPRRYELWVAASTAAGEGDMSAVVAATPSATAGAKIASFPRRVAVAAGGAATLRCAAAGATGSRGWARRRPPPPHADPRLRLDGDALLVLRATFVPIALPPAEAEPSLADNYTCTVRNRWGEEHATWELVTLSAPPRPRLRLSAASPTALLLAWDATGAESYTLEWARGEGPRAAREERGEARGAALRGLACGARYRVWLRAHGSAGASPHSDVLLANTLGGLSKAALEKHLISTNSSCVRLNLLTWDCNGCPLIHFIISIKGFDEFSWRSETVQLEPHPFVFCDLRPAMWHHLRVVATTTAGVTTATYYFSTLTETGERIPAPAQFPAGAADAGGAGGAGGAGALALLAAAAALATALLLLAVIVYKRSTAKCFRKGYEPSSVSEEDKSVEKRDNRRNCQQVYTSSPIKSSKKEQQEMYEISPYATFSMSSGAVCSEGGAGGAGGAGVGAGGAGGAAASGTLRTFGRAEPAPLSAAPPRARHHHDPADSDEYSLSRAMTLMVRRGESDSESSGSPCAECSGAAYRACAQPGKDLIEGKLIMSPVEVGMKGEQYATFPAEEVFRGVTDSSAESCASAARLPARRRPRRHAPPAAHAAAAAAAAANGAARYPQRQEQERRDFTIHV